MKCIDTHSHLYGSKFQQDLDAVIARAKGVLSHVFLPNIDWDSIPEMLSLVEKDPSFFLPMMGLHPCDVKDDWRSVLDKMYAEFGKRKYWGVGETGLDYYWDKVHVKEQQSALDVQIEWAKEMDLPLILHCRESMGDVIDQVRKGQDGRLKGIFHCFTGTTQQAEEVIDLGFLLGIGGVLTYKNSGLTEVVAQVGLSRLVLETDSPYLPPVPYRGQRNESSYTLVVAEKLAEILNITFDEVATITSQNAKKVFGLID
jgi:TatD DNase family protein